MSKALDNIKSFEDPKAISGFRYERIPRNEQEKTLVERGWVMRGFSLLEHPDYPNRYYSLNQAMEMFYDEN